MSEIKRALAVTDFILAHLTDGPRQVRTRERLERALRAAEELLVEIGPEQTSIPEVEKRSGVPRTAIYRYFPDKYALFSAVAAGYMDLLGRAIVAPGADLPEAPWQEFLAAVIRRAATFYNANPVASILIFGGPFTASDHAAHARKTDMLVKALRGPMPDDLDEDTVALTIEIAFACFRYGYVRDSHVTDGITAEAIRAATAYVAAGIGPDPCASFPGSTGRSTN